MNASVESGPGRILVNAVSQMGGRLILTGLRFLIVVVITNTAGAGAFGDYSLLLSLLVFADFLVDFGMTDVAVRSLSQDPGRKGVILAGLIRSKVLLLVAAGAGLAGALLALKGPSHLLAEGLAALPAVVSYAGVLVFRAVLKSRWRMQREVLAEVAGVLGALPLYWLAAKSGGSVAVLIGCYSLSRLLSLGVLLAGSRAELGPVAWDGAVEESRALARQASPLGASLLLVCLYDALDPIVLSQFRSAEEIGWFSGAMRFVALLAMFIYPVADSALPLLAARWKDARAAFRETLATTIRWVALLAGGGFCLLLGASDFLIGLLGREMLPAADVLRVLAFATVGRSLMSVIPPVLIAAGGIRYALWLAVFGVLGKAVVLLWLVPRHGALGAAFANVLGEGLSLLAASLVVRRLTGFPVPWGPVFLAAPACAVALGAVGWLGLLGGLGGGLLAGAGYALIAGATGLVPRDQVREMLARLRRRLPAAGRESASR